jgi:EmrB/QacA subfamily drug resistance transporter
MSAPNKNVVLGLVVITSLITPFLGASVNIALPTMSSHFGMNAITMSWVSMAYLLASAVFLVPMGRLADMVGRVKIFIYGTLIVAVSSFASAFAPTSEVLIILRVIQGLGSSMMFGTNMAIVTSVFPPEQRGKAIGINVTAVYLGLSVAPVLGGIMTQHLGWESIFLITGPLVFVVAILAMILLKIKRSEPHGEKFDYRGSLVYLVSMSSLMYGLSKLPDLYAVAMVLFGIAGMYLFARVELKTAFPVFNMQLFLGNRLFALSNLAALINYATTFAVTFILSLYLQYVKGLAPREAGLVLVVQPIFMALTASFSGKLSDKYPSGLLASLGLGIIATGLVLLLFLDGETTHTYLLVSLTILGIGFGLFSSPNTNSVMSSVERKDLGIASATVATMRLTGQMVSMAIATLVIHVFIGQKPIGAENRDQFLSTIPVTFSIFIALSLLGIWASLARSRKTP